MADLSNKTSQPVKSGITPAAIAAAVSAQHTSTQFDPDKLNLYFGLVSNLCVALAASGLSLPPEINAEAAKINAAASEFVPIVVEAARVAEIIPGTLGKDATEVATLAAQVTTLTNMMAKILSNQNGTAPAGGEGA